MKSSFLKKAATAALVLTPGVGWACACGCGIFDVATSTMLPDGPGGMFFVDYDYQDQNGNFHGTSRAPGQNNDDKEISTHFVTAGLQYMFSRSWGFEIEAPYEQRYFRAAADEGGTTSVNWGSLGDVRVEGIYTGFSTDLSTGVTFGLKLPTGNFKYNQDIVDRDTQIGTGSTDLLLGGFHRQHFPKYANWSWFAQAQLDLPVVSQHDYTPGLEANGALGIYYAGLTTGKTSITPIFQVIASEHTRDCGKEASGGSFSPGEPSSGYQRVLLSPGIEFDIHPFSIYADVELPVFEHVRGDQLVSPALFKLIVSYHF